MSDEELLAVFEKAPAKFEPVEKPLTQRELYQLVLILDRNPHGAAAKFALRLLEFAYAPPTMIKLFDEK